MTYKEWREQVQKYKAALEAARPRFRSGGIIAQESFDAEVTNDGGVRIMMSTLDLKGKELQRFKEWLAGIE